MIRGKTLFLPAPRPNVALLPENGNGVAAPASAGPFDVELLFVECRRCERPLLWEAGKTTEMLLSSGVDISALDEHCLILSDGCPSCSADAEHGFSLTIVRIAGVSPEEAVLMAHPVGSA